jgi:transposase InsO family protein
MELSRNPSVLTSDQGPQFSGQIFQNMCSRLGIRQASSPAHRPQANVRAEVAGKHIITHLRKLHVDYGINWVQALPRVLLQLHDHQGESGIYPYQLLFGRERNLSGLPFTPERLCSDAQDFFNHIDEMDVKIS